MRSEFVAKFNHDDDAVDYDNDVLNGADPIRTGYAALLDWVATQANTAPNRKILDLGAGTGNLTERLHKFKNVVCVDVSEQMTNIGKEKLPNAGNIEWIQSDLLEYFDPLTESFDTIISTYAIHHLTEPEKEQLFEFSYKTLTPNGIAVFGDLMFESADERKRMLNAYRDNNQAELADDIEDEFFWDLDHACASLSKSGFQNITTRRFSDLSWGMVCNKN